EPRHDTTQDANHTDKCNDYKATNPVVGREVSKFGSGGYDVEIGKLPVITPFVAAPKDEYDLWLRKAEGDTVHNGVFVGWGKDSDGFDLPVVAFADFTILEIP